MTLVLLNVRREKLFLLHSVYKIKGVDKRTSSQLNDASIAWGENNDLKVILFTYGLLHSIIYVSLSSNNYKFE